MGQPVKLSDGLVLEARVAGQLVERSIAGQIEFWAAIGRAVEPLLRGDQLLALKQRGRDRPLSECLGEVGSRRGSERLARVLDSRPHPHYESAPGRPGRLVRIAADGTREVGRFVNRKFLVERRTRR